MFRPALVLTSITRCQYRLIEQLPLKHSNVWIAQSLSDKRKVVIKSPLRDDPLLQEVALHGLDTEMSLLSGPFKGKPGIRQLVDRVNLTEELEEIQAAVLVYGEKTLHELHFVEKARLSHVQVKNVTRQLLEALAIIHNEDIVHTDIKPENILITRQPKLGSPDIEVKLMDFASASHVDYDWEDQKTNPRWRSPESWLHMKVTTASEVWALGAIIGSLHMGGSSVLFSPMKEPRDLGEEGSTNWVRAMYTLLPFPDSFSQHAPPTWQARFKEFRASPQMYGTNLPITFDFLRQVFKIPEDDWTFVYNMLEVDPKERLSASRLLLTPYFIPRWKWLLRRYALRPVAVGLQWVLDRTWNAYVLRAQ